MGYKNFLRQLQDYQKRVDRFKDKKIDKGLYSDERNTTIKFIVPLLNILGWNHLTSDMEFEHPVKGKEIKKSTRVDIALYTRGSKKPKIFVEIKRIIQDKLGTGRQVLRYLHAEKVKYGIYTNGKEIRLLDNRTPVKYVPEGLFILKVKDFVKYHRVLAILSKRYVEKGKLDKLAKSFHSERFWNLVKREEKEVKRSERQDLKYSLRLEYAENELKNR